MTASGREHPKGCESKYSTYSQIPYQQSTRIQLHVPKRTPAGAPPGGAALPFMSPTTRTLSILTGPHPRGRPRSPRQAAPGPPGGQGRGGGHPRSRSQEPQPRLQTLLSMRPNGRRALCLAPRTYHEEICASHTYKPRLPQLLNSVAHTHSSSFTHSSVYAEPSNES